MCNVRNVCSKHQLIKMVSDHLLNLFMADCMTAPVVAFLLSDVKINHCQHFHKELVFSL